MHAALELTEEWHHKFSDDREIPHSSILHWKKCTYRGQIKPSSTPYQCGTIYLKIKIKQTGTYSCGPLSTRVVSKHVTSRMFVPSHWSTPVNKWRVHQALDGRGGGLLGEAKQACEIKLGEKQGIEQ